MSSDEKTQTMRAWRKVFPEKKVALIEVGRPPVSADGLLLKVLAAGVCHSDITILDMEKPTPWQQDAFTMGHECCGEVVSVGHKVTKFRPGDMVSVVCVAGCDKPACSECMHGSSHICTSPGVQRYGLGQDGAFAPYIAVRESAAVRVPHGIEAPMAAVATDAVLTAYQAVVGRGKVSADETVLLLGLGGLGFNALQILLHIGARCIAFDKRQLVLDEAVKFGIALDDVIPAETQDIPQ
ncbi:hypothetical protein H2204_003144 [Knufia peltigerae]|uniref:Alcohol dehydrogenase-like N-terminal domain-containing protein n=1 Tax=Knufia peltigerae TaxID=1002370 RepID=A0AA38YA15_9EURO|nr:hypothetical protein H2204_003144 [Knufia peltigerae]